LFKGLALHQPGIALTPHIQFLKWDVGLLPYIHLFLAPSLQSLKLSLESDDAQELAVLFDGMRQKTSSLYELELFSARDTIYQGPALDDMIMAQHHLRVLRILIQLPLSLDVLAHLADLPVLENVGIVMSSQGRNETDALARLRQHSAPFPALRILAVTQLQADQEVHSGPLVRIADLVNSVGQHLEEFKFDGQDLPSAILRQLAEALSTQSKLRQIHIETPFEAVLVPPAEFNVTLHTLAPLCALKSLQGFQISSAHFAFAAGDLAALTKDWRLITRLWLQIHCPSYIPYPVLSSTNRQPFGLDELAKVLTNCPHLDMLSMPLHVEPAHFQSTPRPRAPHNALKTAFFTFAHVPPKHVYRFAAYLAELCPWVTAEESHDPLHGPQFTAEQAQAVEAHFDAQLALWGQIKRGQRECVRVILRERQAITGKPQRALALLDRVAASREMEMILGAAALDTPGGGAGAEEGSEGETDEEMDDEDEDWDDDGDDDDDDDDDEE
jgi:hypothetical protein